MSKVRKSILFSLGQSYASFVLQFVVSIILARLLKPSEIGLYSIAVVLIGFASSMRDFGISSYIIQERDLTSDKIRAAFTLTLFTAWTLALVILLGSKYAAEFYHQPGVRSVMQILALNFVLIPFGTVPMAYMYKKMEFKYIALIKFFTNLTGAVATVSLAYLGYSYLSMAWGSVASILCTFALVQLWRSKDIPFTPGIKDIGKVFSFGSLSSLITILIDIGQSEADLILGRLSGMATVGFFGRAMGLVSTFDTLVMRALWDVAAPHFSEQSRNNHPMKQSFEESLALLTVVAWPFFINLAIMAEPIIIGLYGKQWTASIIPLQLLCIFTLAKSPFMLMGSLMPAVGRIEQNLYQLLMRIPIRGALIFYAAPKGLLAVGIAFIISGIIESITDFIQCRKVIGIDIKGMIQSLHKSFWVTVISCIPSVAIITIGKRMFEGKPLTEITLDILSCSAIWMLIIYITKHPIEKQIYGMIGKTT
ncbi:lipopolysaccharide biosynthesis protein [Ferrovum myxofaciens]|uniref:Lipopolysaccharide biosynthesis protein n=1 Tax=Ferrovum myxofaciens TaxID=416213 RepID=A0A8F3DZR0_9PROT|nr:lipopolysaccharide biosynthesis protein [Ferrovum myxofaciens]KXW57720.1 lipopolysaccharide biosynthesis protein WzxC [Ferrovum myxofaciens]QKE39175.1 MAG: lipopolysaccharide biosynthesis protein [Ferrovum myxofaciens]QKE41714.1 MAG: lipopolysaccharide biosynthesis protein [Ferrovum myxofaciens]QWY74422.1 MAG: lipopolysaccharide biosynthesis protein [Ferrovum myxofaciens]QWY77172.1 MAG: lipopolysaccharide biosynthesis protein [Ferrovum myxofaciens]